MYETDGDVRALERLIGESIERAGPFLKQSFEMPEKSLSARQILQHFDGVSTLALATVGNRGHPRVAPVIAVLYRTRFHVPTVRDALRTRHVRNNPEVSLTAYEGTDFSIIIHGRAALVGPADETFDDLVALQREHSGSDVREWGDPVFLRIDPSRLYTFARYPNRFPSIV